MLKNIFFLILSFVYSFSFSQEDNVISTGSNVISNADFSKGLMIQNPPNNLIGTPYLFKGWFNKNFVHLVNESNIKKVTKIDNININFQLEKFTTKIDNNTIFSFNKDYFDYVIINNRRFEYFDYPIVNKKKLFEIIASINDAKLLKSYSFYIIRGEVQGYQTSRPVDKLKMKSNYFIKNGDHISEFTLKKKTILALMGDSKSKVSKFAKENKLSFKKDKDLVKILHFYNSL